MSARLKVRVSRRRRRSLSCDAKGACASKSGCGERRRVRVACGSVIRSKNRCRRLAGDEHDGAAQIRRVQDRAAVADFADDPAVVALKIPTAAPGKIAEIDVARARRGGRQSETGTGVDAQIDVALRGLEFVHAAAHEVCVEEDVAADDGGHHAIGADARQVDVAFGGDDGAHGVALYVMHDDVAALGFEVDGGGGRHLNPKVDIADIFAPARVVHDIDHESVVFEDGREACGGRFHVGGDFDLVAIPADNFNLA